MTSTLGLFIGRLNPPHIGHIKIIERALKENSKVLILLGTPLISDKNNPLNFETRKKLLKKLFIKKYINILEIKDNESDFKWIRNIKNILEKKFGEFNKINFYGGDFENDSAFNVFREYEENFKNCTFNYILNSRKNSFIEFMGKKYLVSATNFREALNNKNYDLALKFSTKNIFEDIKKEFI